MNKVNNHKQSRLIAGICFTAFLIIILTIFINRQLAYGTENKLGLEEFYGKNDGSSIYSRILKEQESPNTTTLEINPNVEPQMGWKTEGKPVPNPTKIASEGLVKALNGDIVTAKKYAQWLINNSTENDGAMFFPFKFDFAPYWPYSLKAPWNSAITQGLALGLFSYLYKDTGQDEYKNFADKVYKSYQVPLEEGGFTRFEKEGPFFEEYPTQIPTRVLNGAAVAILALHDYAIITSNKDAEKMFKSSVLRLEKLLPQYEVKDPGSGIITSSYSLAPVRPEILGRFVGDGNIFISEMKLIGIKGDSEEVISSVQLGSITDDNVMNEFYVWPDKRLMNWGNPSTIEELQGRVVNGRTGEYGHAPFKFLMPQNGVYDQYAVEITWMSPEKESNKNINVQLYDENQWWPLGTIVVDGEKKLQNKRFIFADGFFDTWKDLIKLNSKIDNKYVDDNQILIDIIGRISGSITCKHFANMLMQSVDLVPARWLNKFPPDIMVNINKQPVLSILPKGDESKHVEHPSVIKVNNRYFMYYCAYGDDNKSRLFMATSPDGINWARQGCLFTDESLPEDIHGNMAFPYVVRDIVNDGYLMYFSVSTGLGQPYDRICWAYSKNGWNWQYGGIALNNSGLKPLVLTHGGYEMFYVKKEEDRYLLMSSSSLNGKEWTVARPIVEMDSNRRGLYTVSGMYFDNNLVLFLESTTSNGRHDILLYTGSNINNLKSVKVNPVIVDRDWGDKWDNIHYGFNIIQDGENYFLYYNGIPNLGDEIGGQIGRAQLNISLLLDYLNKTE